MRQRQGPDTEVGGSVGDSSEHVLNGLDNLVDENLTELELLTVAMSTTSVMASLLILQEAMTLKANLLLLGLLVLPEEDEGFGEEHQRHGDDSVLHQGLSKLHGSRPQGVVVLLTHGHADEGVDDIGGVVNGMSPLVEDHHVHPSEEAEHEDHHRDALKDEVGHVLVVDGVAPAQEQAHNHLQHTEKHGELHLHGVDEEQFVGSSNPGPIKTERVRTGAAFVLDVVDGSVHTISILVHEARLKELQAHGEEIVVHETGESGEDAQTQNHVPRHAKGWLGVAQGLRVLDQPGTSQEEQGAVADIAVHHAEDEGEGHASKQGRVGLLIPANSVGVDDLLPSLGVLVGADVGGRGGALRGPVRVQNCTRAVRGLLGLVLQDATDPVLVGGRVPDVDTEDHALLAHVQDVVDGLLLHAEQAPVLDLGVTIPVARRRIHQVTGLVVQEPLVGLQGLLLVGELTGQRLLALPGSLHVARPGVKVHTEGSAHLDDLVLHSALHTLEVDDEDRLVHDLGSLGVDDLLSDRAELHEHVSTRGPPESSGEALLVRLHNNTGNIAQASSAEGIILQHRAAERVNVTHTGASGSSENLQSGGNDFLLLHSLVLLGNEVHVVLLELDEAGVELLQLTLDLIQLVAAVGGHELVQLVLCDGAAIQLADLLKHEAKNALHLIDTLNVLSVRATHLTCVHVFELDRRLFANLLDVAPSILHGQHEEAILHLL
mmetsp:Transcript_72750/g.151908  ORF Transcript_72750/g.151908 Transcript_72750/m.151908 type:complete len:716 (+) Transcript_72750:458-2605(+)